MRRKIYLASSWKNTFQPMLVRYLRKYHAVYDFRNPRSGGPKGRSIPAEGFAWRDTLDMSITDPRLRLRKALEHPAARAGYLADKGGMDWSDTCVLALPCGRSAHLEAGFLAGERKQLLVYMPPLLSTCQACGGDGWVPTHDPFRNDPCGACKTTGTLHDWAFEDELMYLLGGENVIVTSLEELHGALAKPWRRRRVRAA